MSHVDEIGELPVCVRRHAVGRHVGQAVPFGITPGRSGYVYRQVSGREKG